MLENVGFYDLIIFNNGSAILPTTYLAAIVLPCTWGAEAQIDYFIESSSPSRYKWRLLYWGGALMEHFLEGST